jgi:hypothetical protein
LLQPEWSDESDHRKLGLKAYRVEPRPDLKIRVVYKPRRTIQSGYLIVFLGAVAAATYIVTQFVHVAQTINLGIYYRAPFSLQWRAMAARVASVGLIPASEQTLATLAGFAAGLLLVRERVRVSALCLRKVKVGLAACLWIIVSGLATVLALRGLV